MALIDSFLNLFAGHKKILEQLSVLESQLAQANSELEQTKSKFQDEVTELHHANENLVQMVEESNAKFEYHNKKYKKLDDEFVKLTSDTESSDVLRGMYDKARGLEDEPWAMFEIQGFNDDGQIKVHFNWNKSFIDSIRQMGYNEETEEEMVQMFFFVTKMAPTGLAEQVNPEGHPSLQSNIKTGDDFDY